MVCVLSALVLAVPALNVKTPPKDNAFRWPCVALAAAYAWTALLYLARWTGIYTLLAGYDALTDFIGTLFYVAAWFIVTDRIRNTEVQQAERRSVVFLILVALISGGAKFMIQWPLRGVAEGEAGARMALPDYQAARALLNISTGPCCSAFI